MVENQHIQARQNLGPRLQFLTFSDLHYLKKTLFSKERKV